MAESNIYWFENQDILYSIINRIFEITQLLLENKIYQSDYKGENFVLYFSGKFKTKILLFQH